MSNNDVKLASLINTSRYVFAYTSNVFLCFILKHIKTAAFLNDAVLTPEMAKYLAFPHL